MGIATEKQAGFIRSLIAEREVGTEGERIIAALNSGALDSKSASNAISKLLAAPRKPKATPTGTSWAQAQEAVNGLDTSFYAIPAGFVAAQSIDLRGNDHLFIRVRNYGQRRRIYRVSGSVGGFSYRPIPAAAVVVIAAVIAADPLRYQREFHALTGKCGRCAADLTDLKSRELGFGPDCAKIIGLR